MKVAVVGVTGLVGQVFLKVLEERNFPITTLLPVASSRSLGTSVNFKNKDWAILSIEEAIEAEPEIALFSAGGQVSLDFAPKFAEHETKVIDNSSAWRMDTTKKLIVPEINGNTLGPEDKIIANPNCSTIQMVLALHPLHKKFGIKRIVVSTYQSVTGTGKEAVEQLNSERAGKEGPKVYPHPIDLNALPHIDVFQPNRYTKEEMKMVNETRKILNDDSIMITATCVRLPVIGGHSESVNVEFHNEFDIEEVYELLKTSPGLIVEDDVTNNIYPMPLMAEGRDEVFVGRIRRDESQPRSLNLWVVSDNLRKGAATNAIQIAEFMIECNLIHL